MELDKGTNKIKRCKKCGVEKSIECFYFDRPDHRSARCKDCWRTQQRDYYKKNKPRKSASGKAYYEKNKERQLAIKKAYRSKNKELVAAKDRIRRRQPDYRRRLLVWMKEWKKQKREKDIQYRIREKLRHSYT